MRGIFPADHRLWAAATVLTFAPLTLVVDLWPLARRAWLTPTPDHVVVVIVVTGAMLVFSGTVGVVACTIAPRFGIRLTRCDRAAADDYDDAMLPPFLVPVRPDPPDE
jgi:hypothetical protein